MRSTALTSAILAIVLSLPAGALAKHVVNGSQSHTYRRQPNRLTLSVNIAGTVPRFQGANGAEIPRAGATANDMRVTTKTQVYSAIKRLVPGARVVATHASIAPTQLRQDNGERVDVWRSNQSITITAPRSKQANVDHLRDALSRIDGVVNVGSTSSSLSDGRYRSARNGAEVQAVKKLKKRADKAAPGAQLTQLSLGSASLGSPQPYARSMSLESAAAPAESHFGQNAVSASVSGTWQRGGVRPQERRLTLSANAVAKSKPDLGGIVLSNSSQAPTKAAAVEAHNAKWARVNQLVRQHLGAGFKTVGDSSMTASDARSGYPATASQSWTINNVKLTGGGDSKLYALRQALAEENIAVQLTSGITAGRYNKALAGVQKTVARRAAGRASNAAKAAGANLDLNRDIGLPNVGNEDNLRAASQNRFDVPIQIQGSGSFGFGIR